MEINAELRKCPSLELLTKADKNEMIQYTVTTH